MSQLEAHLTAEVLAAQLLNDQLDAEKLRILRGFAADILAYLDERLEASERAA
jgi:hypothetical protein